MPGRAGLDGGGMAGGGEDGMVNEGEVPYITVAAIVPHSLACGGQCKNQYAAVTEHSLHFDCYHTILANNKLHEPCLSMSLHMKT